jgi:hypothetical protein
MSFALLSGFRSYNRLEDDLESFLWCSLNLIIRYLPCKGLSYCVPTLFRALFDRDNHDPYVKGGRKHGVLTRLNNALEPDFAVIGNKPLTTWLLDTIALMHSYLEIGEDDPSPTHEALDEIFRKALASPGWPSNEMPRDIWHWQVLRCICDSCVQYRGAAPVSHGVKRRKESSSENDECACGCPKRKKWEGESLEV